MDAGRRKTLGGGAKTYKSSLNPIDVHGQKKKKHMHTHIPALGLNVQSGESVRAGLFSTSTAPMSIHLRQPGVSASSVKQKP